MVYIVIMGRCTRLLRVAVVPLVLLLPSCTENADLFNSLDESEGPTLQTVQAGAIVSSTEPISVQLQYPDENMSRATALDVELREPDGTVVGELSFSDEQLLEPELPEIELPRPDPGPYILFAEARRGDEVLFTEERQIFVVDEPPRIRSVSVYPSAVGSDAEAVAVADIAPGRGTRPFLRWSFRGESIGTEYVENGGDRTVFSGGGSIGVHDVRVELYPWGPDEGVTLDQASSIIATTDVFFRDLPTERPVDETTVLRYLFDGQTVPDTDTIRGEFEPVGRNEFVVLDVWDEQLGYRLDGGALLTVPYDVVPTDGDALRLTARVTARSPGGTVSFSVNRDQSSIVSLSVEDRGAVVVESGNAVTEIPIDLAASVLGGSDAPRNVALLLIRHNGRTVVVPEFNGVAPVVIPVSDDEENGGAGSVAVAYDGAGSVFIESVEVTREAAAYEYFDPAAVNYLYDDSSVVAVGNRSMNVDLAVSSVEAFVPPGRFLLWRSRDGDGRGYLMWDRGGELVVSRVPAGESSVATTPDLLPVLFTVTTEQPLTVRAGNTAAATPSGDVVLPITNGGTFRITPGAFRPDAAPLSVRSIER